LLDREWKAEESGTQLQQEFLASQPGVYRFEIEAGPKKAVSQVTLDRQFRGIELQPIRIAGSQNATNALTGQLIRQPLDGTLSWKAVGKVRGPYRVLVLKAGAKAPIVDARVEGETYVLKSQDLLEGDLSYRIEGTPLANGFVPSSELKSIEFKVVPPSPARPTEGSTFSLAGLKSTKGTFLFTWVVTNFTESYEVELGSGAPGTGSTKVFPAKDNFLVFRPSRDGVFWWRVRGLINGKQSVWSETRTFKVSP
jgi:hypothetical protein